MKISKITFKGNQAWVAIRSEEEEYIGTLHVVSPDFVEALRKENPTKVKFD